MDEETALKKARYMVLRLLTFRARSVKEVAEYLERKSFTAAVTEATIKKMIEYGYLDDHKFASDYAAYRKLRGYGLIKVRYELINKGIARQVIDSEIDRQFNPDEDLVRIKELLNKKIPDDEQIDERWLARQVSFLKRRGFQDNLIITALQDYPLKYYRKFPK